jgi:hypothetical protein
MERHMLQEWMLLAAALTFQTTSPYAPGLSCEAFTRQENGCWSPTRSVQIVTDGGRKISITPGITFCPGAMFNGLALAEQLESQCSETAQ